MNIYKERLKKFNELTGEYIQACNQLELVATTFTVKHFFNKSKSKLRREFVDYFITTQGLSQQTMITIFNKILVKHHSEFYNKEITIVKRDIITGYVHLRNILAHSLFHHKNDGTYDDDEFILIWITNISKNAFIKKELSVIDIRNFVFSINEKYLTDKIEKLKETVKLIDNYL